MSQQQYLKIFGSGSCLPKAKISNDQLKELHKLDTSHEWIESRSGICFRHIADKDETTAKMAIAATRQALEQADWSGDSLDLIVCATCTPDRSLPSVAIDVHQALGCKPSCLAFDVGAACSGFIYALSICQAMANSHSHIRRVLIIGAERMSSIVDWSDRSTAVLFGDGAGACLLENTDQPGHYLSRLYADGQHSELLHTLPGDDKILMQGMMVYRHAVDMMGNLVDVLLEEAGFTRQDVDRLVPHQANARIIKALGNKIGLKDEQIIMNIADLGNTSAASIPIALDGAIRKGEIQRDQLILLEAFGAGFVWGGSLLRY